MNSVRSLAEGDLIADRYRLLRRIGSGGMGAVWAARHELLGRVFALKLPTFSDEDRDGRARFLREAKIVGRLRHPNVVDVADVGDAGPGVGLFLVMELLEGASLAEHIEEHGPLPAIEALGIASQVARGLAAAHAAGVVHRDVKPENIFLARVPDGGMIPKLLDFGVSKGPIEIGPAAVSSREPTPGGAAGITLRGRILGTPAYMSPEQAMGEPDVDHRSDLWSLGVVLHEMLAAGRPFEADEYYALLMKIVDREPAPLPDAVAPEVKALVARCLAKSRDDRVPTANALRASLDAVREALQAPRPRATSTVSSPDVHPSIAPASLRPSGGSPGARRTTIAAITVALALAAAAGLWRPRRVSADDAPQAIAALGGDAAATSARGDPGAPAVAPPPPATGAPPASAAPALAGVPEAPSGAPLAAAPTPPAPHASASATPLRSGAPPSSAAPPVARPRAPARSVTRVNDAGF